MTYFYRLQKYLLAILALILTSIIASWVIVEFGSAHPAPNRNDCEGIEIEMIRTQMALIPTSDVAQRSNVENKIKAWETMIAICENNTPASTFVPITPIITLSPLGITPSGTSTSQPISGIFEGQPAPYFHSFEAKIENHWRGIVNGNKVFVFAGAEVSDPSKGFLAVRLSQPSGQAVWGRYPGPTGSGALRIIDARGTRLVVRQANAESLLYFDIPALVYLDSLDAVVTPQRTLPGIVTTLTTSTPVSPYPAPPITQTFAPYPSPVIESTSTPLPAP